jgi:hypothetical protein
MDTGNGSNKAEAEPIARSVATPFKPVKALENVLAFIVRNSRSIVLDRNDSTAVVLSDRHGHLTGVTAVFDGVVDKIGDSIEQKVPVSRDEYALIHDSIEMSTLVFGGGIKQLHNLARDLC